MTCTPQGTFLVALMDHVFEVDLIEVDRRGRLLWCLPASGPRIGCPSGVQALRNGHVLVADEACHVVLEVDRDGTVVWQFGKKDHPASPLSCLSGPKAVREAGGGRRVVADTRNHRVLALDPGGGVGLIRAASDDLCSPAFADPLPDGHYLICDTGNGRVIEVDRAGRVVWQYGQQLARRRWFSFPRSVEATGGGFLVCDTAHNRAVVVQDGALTECPFTDETGLFWPRCVRRLASGSLLIADGRNARVVEVDARGRVLRRLHTLEGPGPSALGDPHDVQMLPNGHLLIVDPSHHLVIEADWAGRLVRAIGGGEVRLKDPHSAQPLPDGAVLIADTGHDRLVYVDGGGKVIKEQNAFRGGAYHFRLNRPRYAEVGGEGVLVVVDTGNNRVLAADGAGELAWELSAVAGSRLPLLHQPRWAQLLGRNEVIVCDHYNHRILHLRYHPGP
jgi:hypothetical protein